MKLAIGLQREFRPPMTEFRAASAGTLAAAEITAPDPPPVLVGCSRDIERLRHQIVASAALDRPVLVSGEPGTGRTLVARALHECGPRADELCAVIACQAFPDTLLEVELFGCAKGSVVGATCDRQGAFEIACGGTVILENIEAMSVRTQGLVGRFLTSGRVQAVGTLAPGAVVHTRIVLTTRMSPEEAAEHLHPDLWPHVECTTFLLPRLQERAEDVPLLAYHFATLADVQRRGVWLTADARAALAAYAWPGNVSQLRSVIERLVSRHAGAEIDAHHLPVGIRPRLPRRARPRGASVGEQLLARVQATGESFWSSVYPLFMKREITRTDLRELIRAALELARGNADDLLRVLNMPGSDRQKFARFLRKYDCELTQ